MSHFTTIQTKIRDLDALHDACVEMGFKFLSNAKCRGYAGMARLAPSVIQLKGPYDIAVDPSPEKDGTYGLTTDWFDGHVVKEVGIGYGRLLQSYGVHKTMREDRSHTRPSFEKHPAHRQSQRPCAHPARLPLLRLDMGRVFGGIVGQSEANLRSVIQTAEAIAPCVLWIDEIEKGFSGSKSSGSTDGGTSSRVFGSFLSWMQEKEKPVFVVATANDVSKLPPEFLRKGRFDELFFVDLPDALERAQIWDIVIKRHGRRPTDYDTVVLSRACEQFTGAEIEAVFIDAMHEAYAEGKEPGPKEILEAMTNTVPLAQLMDGQIAALRHWAKGRAREAASRSTPARNGRRMSETN